MLRKILSNNVTRIRSITGTGGGKEPSVDPIKIETNGDVMIIIMNRHERRNAVNRFMAEDLYSSFLAFNTSRFKAAVLCGSEDVFCAGYDLKEVAASGATDTRELLKQFNASDQSPMGPCKILTKKPIISAIEGYAVAGGLELALATDLRVAASDAKLGFLNRRYNVPLIDGGTVKLTQMVGLSRALDLVLTGRTIDATTAEHWGLVNRVVEPGTAVAEAVKLAKLISKLPSESLLADRRSVYNATYDASTFHDAMRFELKGGLRSVKNVKGAQKFVGGDGRHGE